MSPLPATNTASGPSGLRILKEIWTVICSLQEIFSTVFWEFHATLSRSTRACIYAEYEGRGGYRPGRLISSHSRDVPAPYSTRPLGHDSRSAGRATRPRGRHRWRLTYRPPGTRRSVLMVARSYRAPACYLLCRLSHSSCSLRRLSSRSRASLSLASCSARRSAIRLLKASFSSWVLGSDIALSGHTDLRRPKRGGGSSLGEGRRCDQSSYGPVVHEHYWDGFPIATALSCVPTRAERAEAALARSFQRSGCFLSSPNRHTTVRCE